MPKPKLTDAQVRKLRAEYDQLTRDGSRTATWARQMSTRYRVGTTTILRAATRVTYRHIRHTDE